MLDYHIICQQDDGSWSAHGFQTINDDLAIAHALRVRTANACELFQADHWLATFDRQPQPTKRAIPANDNRSLRASILVC